MTGTKQLQFNIDYSYDFNATVTEDGNVCGMTTVDYEPLSREVDIKYLYSIQVAVKVLATNPQLLSVTTVDGMIINRGITGE